MPLPHYDILLVERAIDDFKRGVPVIFEDASHAILTLPIEYLDQASMHLLEELASDEQAKLMITATRAKAINPSIQFDSPILMPFSTLDEARTLSGLLKEATLPSKHAIDSAGHIEQAALKLIKLGECIPAAIIVPVNKPYPSSLLVLTEDHVLNYQTQTIATLNKVTSSKLPLNSAENSQIVAFRSSFGGKEHYAIIVGDIKGQKSPLVRVHSSCYTGDLLGSLACDCQDQLQTAIRLMGEGEGGIILYLQQEGRGIGLTNKIRAYALKDKGLDTVDANEALGFDDDERLFEPAAQMLKKLKIKSIKLLSNNPRKAEGLQSLGIDVAAIVPHIMPIHRHNAAYLDTKVKRLGHKMPGSGA